ncbi:AsmA family protein [Bosea sp. CS1GBMeth4]|uniref:AsmA family protein n=1 Tax=Bosea sp. CS1GBMeth4 TaxID=1892849 RepID=UPI00164661BD|nr:AsmA family protein [Bosea sp. CS1GBMeth4]
MSRRALILGLAAAALLLALGLQPWNLALSQVERSVVAGIEARTGLKVTALRRAEIAFLPLPRISLSDVTLSDPQGVLSGKAARLRARARLLSLIGGELDFDRIDLVAPELDIAVAADAGGYADWLDRAVGYLARLESQPRLVLTSGSIMMRSAETVLTTLRDVNIVVEERDARAPIALAGSLTWRGEATDIDLLWPVAGERARTALSLGSRLMRLRLEGTRSTTQKLTSGEVEFSTKSLSDALAWIGPRPRIASLVQQVELTARAQVSQASVSLDTVVAKVDGDRLEGALKLEGAMPNWALSGTLAGAEFDLGRLLRQAEPQVRSGGETGSMPLEFDGWTANDVDLRLSLDSARIGPARFGDLAAQLLIRKGRFEAALLRAAAYGGTTRARILATPVAAGADVKLQFGVEKLNLALAADDLPELARLSGTASGQLSFDGVGSDVDQVVGSLTGRANLTIRQGEFRGIAFPDLLRKAEKPPASARDWRQGKSAFETLQLTALANLGVLYLTETQLAGSGYTVVLNGTADLGRRWLDLNGALSSTTTSTRVPFDVRGPFFGAAFTPEIDAALRAPGPALPLLR